MDEYVNKKCIYDIIYKHQQGLQNMGAILMLDAIDKEVQKVPPTDVQPVVHCKDCKHRKEHHYEEIGEKPYIKYECKFTKYSMSDNGFCSFGARIDNNTRGKVNELGREVSRPDGNCLDCKFQYLNNSDYWCSICPGNPEDI